MTRLQAAGVTIEGLTLDAGDSAPAAASTTSANKPAVKKKP